MNLEASTLTNGACARRARRRASSVFPTPVGPMRMMFAGWISSRMSSSTRQRRQRLRSAMATAFLAFAWPITYLSSSATISRGVSSATSPSPPAAGPPPRRPGAVFAGFAARAGFFPAAAPRSARPRPFTRGPRPRSTGW